MLQFGGKSTKTSSESKRHFTVVMENKEHGLYVSSTPSSAARKAVTKLCSSNKSKKVEFCIREITQGSKKKTYGPYLGHIEKLKDSIELKGRIIKYKPIAKLIEKRSVMKGGILGLERERNYERADTEKMFENFLVENQESPEQYHLKKRMMNPDNLYFGVENLIEYQGKKYYPYCLINITSKNDGLENLYLRILIQNTRKQNNDYSGWYGFINSSFTNKKKFQNIKDIADYKIQTIKVLDLLGYLKYKIIPELNKPSGMSFMFSHDLQKKISSYYRETIKTRFPKDEDLYNFCKNYIMRNERIENIYLFTNIFNTFNNINIDSIPNYKRNDNEYNKIFQFREEISKYLEQLQNFLKEINEIIDKKSTIFKNYRNTEPIEYYWNSNIGKRRIKNPTKNHKNPNWTEEQLEGFREEVREKEREYKERSDRWAAEREREREERAYQANLYNRYPRGID
jgi:hypothetical protein